MLSSQSLRLAFLILLFISLLLIGQASAGTWSTSGSSGWLNTKLDNSTIDNNDNGNIVVGDLYNTFEANDTRWYTGSEAGYPNFDFNRSSGISYSGIWRIKTGADGVNYLGELREWRGINFTTKHNKLNISWYGNLSSELNYDGGTLLAWNGTAFINVPSVSPDYNSGANMCNVGSVRTYPCWMGTTSFNFWQRFAANLTDFIQPDGSVAIRFYFSSDATSSSYGWLIDDVRVYSTNTLFGNSTHYYFPTTGTKVYRIDVNYTNPTNTNHSLNTYNNGTGNFLETCWTQQSGNQSCVLTQNISYPDGININSTSFSNLTSIGEEIEVTFWTQSISPGSTPPTAVLNYPLNGTTKLTTINFNVTLSDDLQLQNVSLFGNFTGTWALNETKNISGTLNTTIFTKTLSDGTYLWGVRVYDNNSLVTWSINRTLIVNSSANIAVFLSPTPNNVTLINRSYIEINISSDITSNALLEWNGVNESMTQSGTIWTVAKSSVFNSNYTFKVFVSDVWGGWQQSSTRYVNISKHKIFFNNISEVYGYQHNTSTPWSTWQTAIITSANNGKTYNYSDPANLNKLDDKGTYVLNMALAYRITNDNTYLSTARNALMLIEGVGEYDMINTSHYEFAYGAQKYSLGYWWIEGELNETDVTLIRTRLGNLTEDAYWLLDRTSTLALNKDYISAADKHAKMYPAIAIAGVVLDPYVHTNSSSTEWIKTGTDYLWEEDLIHSYNRSFASFLFDNNGINLMASYFGYYMMPYVAWINVYSDYYNQSIFSVYPLSEKSFTSFLQHTYPNFYSTNYMAGGSTKWYDFGYGIVRLFPNNDTKSKFLYYMETLDNDTSLPYGGLTRSDMIDDYVKYLSYNDYQDISRVSPQKTTAIYTQSSGNITTVFRSANGTNNDTNWLSWIVYNINSTISRDSYHHDQLSFEWYNKGDLLLSDGGEPKYILNSSTWYGEYEIFHNSYAIDNQTPWVASSWANSTSRGFQKTSSDSAMNPIPEIIAGNTNNEFDYMYANVTSSNVVGATTAAAYALTSPTTQYRAIMFPKDYFVVVDRLESNTSWGYRNTFRPSSFMASKTTNYSADEWSSEMGKDNVTLFIDGSSYNWSALSYRGGDTLTGTTTSNIYWNTVNPVGNNVTASLYSVPSSEIITMKSVGRIGGYNWFSEVLVPVVQMRVNSSKLYRITVLQANYSTEIPRTTSNLSIDSNRSGILITNATTRDLITASNSTNGTYSNVTTNADVSFSRKATSLSYISAINVSYFKYDSDVWVSSDARLTSIFLNQSGYNRTIVAEGISGTNVSIYVTGTNYTVKRNGVTYSDWYMPDSTHLEINMTFSSPTTYELTTSEAEVFGSPEYVQVIII